MLFDWNDPIGTGVVWAMKMLPSLLAMAPGLVVALWARSRVAKARRIGGMGDVGVDGASAARTLLMEKGVKAVEVVERSGTFATFYDSKRKQVRLDRSVYSGRSPWAIALAAHEAGHAFQDSLGLWLIALRTPIVLGTWLASIVSWLSMVAGMAWFLPDLVWRAGTVYSGAVFTLMLFWPVERDANRRVLALGKEVDGLGAMPGVLAGTAWVDLAAMSPSLDGYKEWRGRPKA